MKTEKLLIFVSTQKELPELTRILDKKPQERITVVLAPDIDRERLPAKQNISYKRLNDYEGDKENLNLCSREASSLIKRWQGLQVNQEFNFDQLTLYKGVSLWQVHAHSMLMYYFIDLFHYIRISSAVIEVEDPRQVIVLGSKTELLAQVFLNLARQKDIPASLQSVHRQIILSLPKMQAAFEKKRTFLGVEFFIYIPAIFYNLGLFVKNTVRVIGASAYNYQRGTGKRGTKKIIFFKKLKKRLDSMIPLVKELEKDGRISVLLVDLLREYGDFLPVLRRQRLSCKVFAGYATPGINRGVWQMNNLFLERWRLLEQSRKFQESLNFDGIFLWELIRPYLKELFLRHFCKMVWVFETAKRLFDIENPGLTFVTAGRESDVRLCTLAAQKKRIRSVAILREIVSDTPEWGAPVYQDKEIVDGKYSHDILCKQGVDPDKLIICPNPRWDDFFLKRRATPGSQLFARLNIPPEKKLIVLTTTFFNPFVKYDEYQGVIRGGCLALRDLAGYHLVIKLHPADNNQRLVYSICKETGIKNVSVIKNINLPDLIAASELLITLYSTTGLEAIMLDKPLIIANLSKIRTDIVPYVSSGVAVGVYRQEDIAIAVRDILNNKSLQQRLKAAREKFIPEHIQHFDGRATKRLADMIREMIREKEDRR
ncbi:CDP-glycerol glycerophosphotransferase family protein [Candidatus Omnitrophota bacterium]